MKAQIVLSLSVGVFSLFVFPSQLPGANQKMPRYVVTGYEDQDPERGKAIEGRKLSVLISEPATADEAKRKAFFDLAKTLPEPTVDELQYETGRMNKSTVRTRHITKVFSNIHNKKFSDPKYGLQNAPATEAWVKTFPDMLEYFHGLKSKPADIKTALDLLRTRYPEVWKEVDFLLPSLVQSHFLNGPTWDPNKEESAPGANDDGMFFMPYWRIKPVAGRHQAWLGDLPEPKVYQAGVVIFGTLAEIKRIERDYRLYPKHIKVGYYAAAPIENSYWVGVNGKGNEFTALEVFFRQDLPFPYDSTRYAMKLLDHYNDKGFYVSDYYSSNRVDLNWMAGRDTFFPLITSSGKTIGYLIGTELGFDIRSVPEGDKDRLMSIRGAWGNIKRLVEGVPLP